MDESGSLNTFLLIFFNFADLLLSFLAIWQFKKSIVEHMITNKDRERIILSSNFVSKELVKKIVKE